MGTGFPGDPVIAEVLLDPYECNLLLCSDEGFVATLAIEASDCAEFTGCGTGADPLVPNVIVSPDGGNALECTENGLYVATSAAPTLGFAAEMTVAADFSETGGSPTATTIVPFDTVSFDIGGLTDPTNDQMVIPTGGAGFYQIDAYVVDKIANDSGTTASPDGIVATIEILVNGTDTYAQSFERYSETAHFYKTGRLLRLADADTVQVQMTLTNDAGNNLATWLFESVGCSFQIARLGV